VNGWDWEQKDCIRLSVKWNLNMIDGTPDNQKMQIKLKLSKNKFHIVMSALKFWILWNAETKGFSSKITSGQAIPNCSC